MPMAQMPSAEQLKHLLEGPVGQPFVMVNLIRFKPVADGSDGKVSGAESYQRYGGPMQKIIGSIGGRLLWSGFVDSVVIGEPDDDEIVQMVALVEYPSREAFVPMLQDPRLAEIGGFRMAGLDGQWLFASTQVYPPRTV